MKKDIRMIALDLDGTLLNDKKQITSYTKEVLKKAMAQGVLVLIATGRPFTAIDEELNAFPEMRYALTSNGARIIDVKAHIAVSSPLFTLILNRIRECINLG